MQGGHHNYKTLKPHANINEDRNNEYEPRSRAAPLKPEELGTDHVAGNHYPVSPPVGSKGTILEGIKLVGVASIPSDEKLHPVGVADNRAGRHDHLAHQLQVANGNYLLQLKEGTHGNHQCQHHAKTREHGSSHKIRREYGRVPARQLGDGKVKGHDRVNRQHQRSTQTRQEQIRLLIITPVAVTADPAHREDAIKVLLHLVDELFTASRAFIGIFAEAISNGSQVRNQAHVPE